MGKADIYSKPKNTQKAKFYVVWKGRQPGIYTSWEACAVQVNGFTGAEYKAFETRQAAELAFKGLYADYKGKKEINQRRLIEVGQPIPGSYCVDAACNGSPGQVEYRCVALDTGQEIFRQGPFERGTNNIGEFLAIVHALALLLKNGIANPVYSDSETALNWVRQKKCKTNLKRDEQNGPLFDLITRAEEWLHNHAYENPILKWDTDVWGEIPADFGRK